MYRKKLPILALVLALAATFIVSCIGGQHAENEYVSFTLSDNFSYSFVDVIPERAAYLPLSEISRAIVWDKEYPNNWLIFISYPGSPDLLTGEAEKKTVNGVEVVYAEEEGFYTQCYLDPIMPVSVKAVKGVAAREEADRIVESLKVKKAVELTPEEQAVQMVISLLYMCKEGHLEAAVDRFIDIPGGEIEIPEALMDMEDYTVASGAVPVILEDGKSPVLPVKASISTIDGDDAELLFICSEDGKHIVDIREDAQAEPEDAPLVQQEAPPDVEPENDVTQTPSLEREWIVDRMIYVDFVPGVSMLEAEAVIAGKGCEIYEWGRLESGDVLSYTLLVPEGSDEREKVEEFKAEPLVLKAGDYYWEKKIERMVDHPHSTGEVLVGFVDGVDDNEAVNILSSHGYGMDQINRLELPYPVFKVSFPYEGDDKDEMVQVIRDFLLDERVQYAEPNYLGQFT